ncbi:hypothetical protein, partial [Bilophila sp.]|uniref:hypothetical protein n=1 Tax=Bilophila sp. TaxID=1929485 RepID=UPI003077E124
MKIISFTLIFPLMGSMAGEFYWLYYSMWLFHLHRAVENTAFFPVFPLAGATAKAFCRLSLWNFKEKNINYFLYHSHFIGYSLGISRKRQPFPNGTAFKNIRKADAP